MSLFDDDDMIFDDDGYGSDDGFDTSIDVPSLAEPKASTFCLGHDRQEKEFLSLFEKNNLPHAMIFAGLEGIGKTTMAFRLAKFLFKHGVKQDDAQDALFGGQEMTLDISSLDVDEADPVVRRVISGAHGDLLHIQRNFDSAKGKADAAVRVEAARKIEPFLRKKSSTGGWRVVIIEDADTMNRNAQNAILKILEEPPSKVLIILIAHRPGRLIPTIHSRARTIHFEPNSKEVMSKLLAMSGHHISGDRLETLSLLSQGSTGLALRYLDQGGIEMLTRITALLENIGRPDWKAIHALSNELGSPSSDKDYRVFQELLCWILDYSVQMKAKQRLLPDALRFDAWQNMVASVSLCDLIAMRDQMIEHFQRVDFSNLDRRDAVRNAFLVLNK